MTALEPSISVNVFSDTAELLAYYRIQQRSLESLTPFLKSPSEVAAQTTHTKSWWKRAEC